MQPHVEILTMVHGPGTLLRFASGCSCGWEGQPQPRYALACSEFESHLMDSFDPVGSAERITREAVS